MSHLDEERTCAACGESFKLSEHAVAGAEAVAHSLDAGTLAVDDAPAIVRTCPKCLGTEQMDAAAAHAELFRLEHATKRMRDRHIPRDVKTYASGLAFMGTALLLGSYFVGALRGHTTLSWAGAAAGAAVAVAGVLVGVVAVVRAYGLRNRQL